ncbi:MAG TPA: hypothetical protein VNF73_08980 [Candidatus Saccharimonadales bacterium]|nr:hypothetical protein [Candidatus Saccharimonadales bacterium]
MARTGPNAGARRARAERRLYKRLIIAFHDVVELQACHRELSALGTAPDDDQRRAVIAKALATNLIVGYGRLFSANKDTPDVARHLPPNFVDRFPASLKRAHEELMRRRNTEFAHSDPRPSEVVVRVIVGPAGQPVPVPESSIVRRPLDAATLDGVREILETTYAFIYDEMERIRVGLTPGETF